MREICSKLAIKTHRRQRHCSGVYIDNVEQNSHIVLSVLIVEFK